MTTVQHSAESAEWYTPPYIIDVVREILDGHIDLDPASCEQANAIVRAKHFFNENGESRRWPSDITTVFCNPPNGKGYPRGTVRAFWERCALEILRPFTLLRKGIFLCYSLEQLQSLQNSKYRPTRFAVIFPRKRISFISPKGESNSPTHANALIYMCKSLSKEEIERVSQIADKIGSMMVPVF